jgi:dephospho-CoA kinase
VPPSPNASSPPIGPYERRQAAVRPWDPHVLEVAERVIAIIRAARPDLDVEHIGSTAVAGLPGKGIVDLGTEADPADIPAITAAMYELGFGAQPGPDPWPATRPMHVGSVIDRGVEYRIHFHVHPRGTGDLAKDLRFRDALRADPSLLEGYARVKQEIVDRAGGQLDGVIYQAEKGGWILDVYDRLGIERPANVGGGPTGEADSAPADPSPSQEDTRDG